MLQPGKPGLEVLVTEGALEGPILGVEDHVLLQVRPPAEGLQADLIGDGQRLGSRPRALRNVMSAGCKWVLRHISSRRSASSSWRETPQRGLGETWWGTQVLTQALAFPQGRSSNEQRRHSFG